MIPRAPLRIEKGLLYANILHRNFLRFTSPLPLADQDSMNHYVITLAPTASKLYVNGALVVGGGLKFMYIFCYLCAIRCFGRVGLRKVLPFFHLHFSTLIKVKSTFFCFVVINLVCCQPTELILGFICFIKKKKKKKN